MEQEGEAAQVTAVPPGHRSRRLLLISYILFVNPGYLERRDKRGGLCKQRALAWGIDAINLVMHSYSSGPNRAIDPPGHTHRRLGAPWDPPRPPGGQGRAARGSGVAQEVAGSWAGALGREKSGSHAEG